MSLTSHVHPKRWTWHPASDGACGLALLPKPCSVGYHEIPTPKNSAVERKLSHDLSSGSRHASAVDCSSRRPSATRAAASATHVAVGRLVSRRFFHVFF